MLYDPKWEAPVETKPAEPWRRLLLDAANAIEQRGWVQGELCNDKTGAVCTVGALNVAAFGVAFPTGVECHYYLYAVTNFCKTHRIRYIPDWNDEGDRTKEQVVAALRDAAHS